VDEVGHGATAMLEGHPERHTWGLGRAFLAGVKGQSVADLEYQVRDHVATILPNRPERWNAFTLAMVDAWADR
jgi:hypothetical protein